LFPHNFIVNHQNGSGVSSRISGFPESDKHYMVYALNRDIKVIDKRLEETQKINFELKVIDD